MTEQELLKKISKDPSCFSELFTLYYKPIFGYILRRTGDFDQTADIAADTFLKAFLHIKSFSYKGIPIKVWLYRIATNEVNQFFRHRQKHDSVFERLEITDKHDFNGYLEHDKEVLEVELYKHGQFLSVLEALKKLPSKYQDVVALRYFEGKAPKEIAEILNINEGTLKSLLSRGVQKLREKCNQL